MFCRSLLTTALFGALAMGTPAAAHASQDNAKHTHSHSHEKTQAHDHSHELKLNDGEKWRTDPPLRKAMTEIRTLVADTAQSATSGALPAERYVGLADQVDGQIDYMIENCALPPDADAQLHIIIERMIGGVAQMRESDGQEQGVTTVAHALEDYGTYFDHEGGRPLPN